jgi:hypothetical protein
MIRLPREGQLEQKKREYLLMADWQERASLGRYLDSVIAKTFNAGCSACNPRCGVM